MSATSLKVMLVAFAALSLTAAEAQAYEAIANVESVTPTQEIFNVPYQSCSTEYQQSVVTVPPPPPQDHSVGGAIIGGVAGGLIGSLFGHGNGKVAMAAVGAGAGAIAGDRIGSQPSSSAPTYTTTTTPVERCRQVDHYDVRTVYTVVYELQGQRYTTKLPYNPGSQLRVNVSVTPK
jgi:uncharacterized protein YcfJ